MAISHAAGIGLRTPHMTALAAQAPGTALSVPWLEIHSENFLCDGGPRLAMLDAIAARYPLSCHGVGLSLGSAGGLEPAHLKRLRNLFERVKPALLSEHLAWSREGGVYLNDLLPLPYTGATLDIVCRNVTSAQDAFGRRLLIENPAAYVSFAESTMPETDFLAALAARTGCGLLLDIGNVHVSAINHGFDAAAYLRAIPGDAVGEVHLAGSSVSDADATLLIDTHATPVPGAVWQLYAATIARIGPRPTLIEWDRQVPALSILVGEAEKAQAILDQAEVKARVA